VPLGTEVGLGPDDTALVGVTAPRPKKLAEPPFPIFGPCLLWPIGCIDQGGTWRRGGAWFRLHCARWGPSSPPQKGSRAPNFRPTSIVPNSWMDQDATWGGGRPRPKRHCVTWGRSSPQKGHSPQFSAHVYCGQTDVCIRIPLGTEVDLA